MTDRTRTVTARLIVQLLFVVVVVPLLPLLVTQRWRWWQAWAFALVFTLGFVVSRVLMARRHPDLLAERARGLAQEGTKSWDRTLAPLVAFGAAAIPLVAGIDVRLGGSPAFGTAANVVALAVMLAGYALGSYAAVENRFFSGTVRIQAERGHHVVTTGPYRWVRHPGYAGAIASYLAVPVLLDSAWALLAALAVSAALVVRTRLEDETLRSELDGYRAYSERTRHRLVPGLW